MEEKAGKTLGIHNKWQIGENEEITFVFEQVKKSESGEKEFETKKEGKLTPNENRLIKIRLFMNFNFTSNL